MKTEDFLMQRLSERKLFGCTIDDITNIVAEIMDERDKKLTQRFEYVLYHASGGNVSKYDTDLQTITMQIDEYQSKHHYEIVKQDIQDIIDGEPDFGEAILSVQRHINDM